MKKAGFIDIQVNGYNGIDFNCDHITEDGVVKAAEELAKSGTAAFCPTMVTSPLALYERNLPILARAAKNPESKGRILGLHIEGPFISPEEGSRGAHRPEFIVKPSIQMFDRLMDLAQGLIKIMTLSPEVEGAAELVRHAVSKGVVCSMGHHMASDEDMAAAVSAGMSLYTHLGNGMVEMISRHKNPLWWALACDSLYGSFITDGHHLPEDFISVALRAKGSEKFIVTSDSSSLAGMPPGAYESLGKKVVLDESGRISLAGTPYLAGSSADMLACMNHLASFSGLCETDLWKAGLYNPLKLIGVKSDAFEKGLDYAVEYVEGRFVVS